MQEFEFSVEIFLGRHCCGREEYVTAEGSLTLDDDQVDQLVALIKENNGETDIEALDLETKYPEIYEALEDAYIDEASEACYRHWVIEGYENGYLDEPDNLMETLEQAGLFKYEIDPDDFDMDEDELEEEKEEAFNEWLNDYLNALDEDELISFLETYYDLEFDGTAGDYDYTVEIPQEIADLANN